MSRRILAHAADTGIEATAPSLEALVEEVLRGMSELVARAPATEPGHWVTVESQAAIPDDALFDVLSDLIYRSEVDDVLFYAFRARIEAGALVVEAGGIPFDAVTATGPAIKAVTYHGLEVEEQGGTWRAVVYFDV